MQKDKKLGKSHEHYLLLVTGLLRCTPLKIK